MIKRLILNTISNYVVLATKLILTFILTPILVHNMGLYDYGLWEIVTALVGYAGILDLGLTPTISRFAAKYRAEEDRERLQAIFSTSVVFMLATGLLIGITGVIVAVVFSSQISGEVASSSNHYQYFLLIISVHLFFKFPGIVVESFLEGFQKYYLKNSITVINSIIGAFVLVALVSETNALILLALVNTIGLSLKYGIYFLFLSKDSEYPTKFESTLASFATLRELLRFGLKSFVQGISFRLERGTDALVIAYVIGASVVPFYTIPMGLINYFRLILMTSTHVFMPLFSELDSKGDQERIVRIYLVASRLVVAGSFLLGIGIVILGARFIGLWMGPEFFAESRNIIVLLVLFSLVPSMNPFCSRYLTAIGKHGIFAKLAPISAVLNIALSVYFAKRFGIWGVALGSLIPVLLFVPIYMYYSCRELGIAVSKYVNFTITPVILPSAVTIAVGHALVTKFVPDSYGLIAFHAISLSLTYVVAYYIFSSNKEMRSFVTEMFGNQKVPRITSSK